MKSRTMIEIGVGIMPDEEDPDPAAGQDAGAAAGQEEGSGEDA